MEYDFRNKNPAHDSQYPQMYGNRGASPLYPRIGQPSHQLIPPPPTSSFHQNPPPPSSSSSAGLGIRVAIKPQFRITPPPQLSSQVGDIPRSTFQFDFDLERKVLAEAEKDKPNWSRLGVENLPSKSPESTSSMGSVSDPVVSKYIASGLSREAASLAVANYGDNPTKVREFVNGYNLLREMGFSSNNVAEALAIYDNDTDKALAHFLNSSS